VVLNLSIARTMNILIPQLQLALLAREVRRVMGL